jgi:hypothetical protein
MQTTDRLGELAASDRGELVVDTGLTYDGVTPVRLRVSRRDGRYKVTDDGEAVATAGVGTHRVAFPGHIPFGEYSVNVTRHGAVWLPVVRADAEWLEAVCGLVASGSVALYERLLELEE